MSTKAIATKHKLDLVVAVDLNRGIGRENGLPWRLPSDMKRFRRLTSASTNPDLQNAVIMGRKTWDSIPEKFRPLDGRVNIVLTGSKEMEFPSGVLRADSLEQAVDRVSSLPVDRCFIIGGASIYEQAISHPLCDLLFITEINATFECDVFFPRYEEKFELLETSDSHTENGVEYRFKTFQRKW